MIVSRANLLDVLNKVRPGKASKSHIKEMENVQFSGQDVITYNDQVGIMVPFETDFEASVNYDDFHKIISKLDTNELDLEVVENELLITTEGTKAGLVLMNYEVLGVMIDALVEHMPNDANDLKWIDIPSDFLTGVSLCTPAAESNVSKGILACMYTNGTNIICTDNARIAIYNLTETFDESFLIRAGLVSELSKFDAKQICVSDAWVNFSAEDKSVFSARRVRGDGLDFYLEVLDGFDGKALQLPDGLKEIVNAASVMSSNDDDKEMGITLKDGEMICTTQNERGWVEKSITVEGMKKSEMELNVSAVHLAQILDLPDIKMTVGDGKSLFESGNFKYILLHRGEE